MIVVKNRDQAVRLPSLRVASDPPSRTEVGDIEHAAREIGVDLRREIRDGWHDGIGCRPAGPIEVGPELHLTR